MDRTTGFSFLYGSVPEGPGEEDEILSPTWLACFLMSLAGDFLLGIIVTAMGQSSVQQQIRVYITRLCVVKRHHGL